MASMTIWCPCKVETLGKATVDLYTLPYRQIKLLLSSNARCCHCGRILRGQKSALEAQEVSDG